MGFGFNIIGFAILVLLTILLLIGFARTKNKNLLKGLGIIWALLFILGISFSIIDYYQRPIRLTKKDIVGIYQIDTNLCPGPNAQWQYNHFKYEITPEDSFIFIIIQENGDPNELHGKVIWKTGPPDLWKIEMIDTKHHIIERPPLLFRGHNKFYYVFKSYYWNNLFFRKKEK